VKEVGYVIWDLTTNEMVRNIRLTNIEVAQNTSRITGELGDGVS